MAQMRLSALFLSVLAIAAVVSSLAAWGVTYGTAYHRVSAMASDFTNQTLVSFERFGLFVTDLMHDNGALVDSILVLQERSGTNRTEQVKWQITQTVGVLVNARKAEALTEMAVTTGWTVVVVVAILLAVLGASAWGTTQVANALNHIIRLMEDVADMKVENLTVPQGHRLREVARIQSAFQVLVLRLVEYKSYIPMGVFERRRLYEQTDGSEDGHTTDQGEAAEVRRVSSRQPSHQTSSTSVASSAAHAPVQPIGVPAAQQPPRSTKKSVAVLSVNASSLVDILDHELRQQLLQKFSRRLKFNMMLSFGLVLANTVGYSKFKFMVAGFPVGHLL